MTQGNETYTHTPIGQLAAVNAGAYAYDPADNLTQHASGTRAAYDSANQLCWTAPTAGTGCATPPAGGTTYGYDNRGNRTTTTPTGGGAISYGYDQANRLTTAPTASYTYNGDGLRTAKTVSGNTSNFLWNEAQGLPLLLGDGTNLYIYGPGGLPIEHVNGSTPTYYHQDQLGSTRLLTDNAGATVATYTFDAYGNQTTATGTATTPLRYAGEYRDDETGFYYLRARYYDPSTGQLLTRDPATALTRDAYAYTNGSPLNATDPNGMAPCSAGAKKCEKYDSRHFSDYLKGKRTICGQEDILGYPSKIIETKAGKRAIEPDGACTSPRATAANFDFQNACKTHDYAYDLLRGYGGSAGDRARADKQLRDDMYADCEGRGWFGVYENGCRTVADGFYAAVTVVSATEGYGTPKGKP